MFFLTAAVTLKYCIAKTDFALKDFTHIGEDGVPDAAGIFFDELAPIVIGAKNLCD